MSVVTWTLFGLAALCIVFKFGLGLVVFATAAFLFEVFCHAD